MKAFLPLLILLLPMPALAQSETPSAAEVKKQAALAESRIDENMVTMSNLAEALSNNMGQLHYLRTLCFGTDDQKWRIMASNMMNVETPREGARRSELIRAFNAGYYSQQERHQDCSGAVAIDVAALSENGRRLSEMLGDPYRE